jgi:hypothetical protein
LRIAATGARTEHEDFHDGRGSFEKSGALRGARRRTGSARADVHRDLEAEAKILVLGGGPLHGESPVELANAVDVRRVFNRKRCADAMRAAKSIANPCLQGE